ncbi:MAG: TlpA family protein disulfide reductase [Myxococcota bacterium]|nr:TlpA family protein disulfide reductase [Myxococcota bacterium]
MHRTVAIRSLSLRLILAIGLIATSGCGAAEAESDGASSPADARHPLLGNKAPNFSRKAVTGQGTVSSRSLAGKVAIVDFWATWCEPCKKSFPKLEALNAKYKNDGLQVIGISEDDDKEGIPLFASDLGAEFPLIWDQNKAIAAKWQPKSMPSTFVVDRKGTVRFVHLGYHSGEEAEIEREVKSLL